MAAKLLIVDDDRLVLATLARGLRSEGYDVDTAEDGEAAIEAAGRTSYDLVISDIRMPTMTGVELAHRLKQQHNLPAMFLSAFNDKDMVRQALAEGGLGYVIKPVEVTQLAPAIEAALARARDINALAAATEQLQTALTGGRNTNAAMGILMERHRLTHEDAFNKLRAEARKKNCKIEDLATTLVEALNGLNSVLD